MENNELRNDFISLERNKSEFISLERKNNEVNSEETFEIINNQDIYQGSENVKVKSNWKVLFFVILGILGITVYTMLLLNVLNGTFSSKTSNILKAKPNENRAVMQTLEGSDKLYTSAGIYEENVDSIVAIQTEIVTTNMFGQTVAGASAGSGFVISEDGYILTNAHVVDSATSIKVKFENGEEYKAELVGFESENDIAVLKISANKLFNAVILGDSDKMVVGEDVVTIGNPLGELTFSLTKGVVSALDREIMVDKFTSINMFQVDCAVNQGNSGGPVFNMYGEVIGIVSAKYASSIIEGLGFCIPINDVSNIVTDLIEHGKVVNKAYMGVSVSDIDANMIKQYNMVKGAYVSIVEKGSSAEKAGLKIGDIIVQLGNEKVESVSDLLSAKRGYKSGETVMLKVYRSGEYIELSITFEEYNEEEVAELEKKMNEMQGQVVPQVPNNSGMTEDEMLEEIFKYYFNR